jgi:non-ribosomal peptide synthetase-like protein
MATSEAVLLHQIFEAVARRYPERVAVEIPPGSGRPLPLRVTYAELHQQASAIADALRLLARRDAVVAILLPRETPALYAAQLGVLKAGAAYTCLDPKFPDEHLGSVLQDADAVALITTPAGRQRLGRLGVRLPPIIDADDVKAPGNDPSGNGDDSSRLAYVIYTSGTTGQPKGVLIEHRGVVNLVASNIEHFGLTCKDRVAQCSSAAYDSSVEETWLAFAVGATLVPLDDETVRLGPDLIPWLRRERITVLCPPPTLLRATQCADPQRELPELRLLYVGGEPLPSDLADRWSAGRRMENGYGPTECTVTVVRGAVRSGKQVTIGTPVPGHRAWVLDEVLREVPDGEAGELCVAGMGLARGYHKREALTAAKFPHHPHYGRIYRTGDLVRRTEQGDLEHLGRIDGQVKLRGYRIELGAIEAHLEACPGVRAAACCVHGAGAAQVLVGHVVPESAQAPPNLDAIKESLRRSLPAYMVPSRFGFLDRLPTGIGGKLDRKALPEIEATSSANRGLTVLPRNDDERLIAESFARVLGLRGEVSIHDDFFLDLGGDSLTAVAFICALRASGRSAAITVRDLYEVRTAAAMAERLRAKPTESAPSPRQPSGPRLVGRPVLTTALQGLWLGLGLVVLSTVCYFLVFECLPWLLGQAGLIATLLLVPLLQLFGLVLYVPCAVALTIFVKLTLIGRYRAIRVPVWRGFYVRHWIVTHVSRLIPWWLLEGTVFQAVVLRALGAHVGRRVHMHRGVSLRDGGWDLLTIGDDVTLAQDAEVRVTNLDDGQLVLGPVTIDAGATLDVRAGLSPHTTVQRNGYLTALSWLPSHGRIPEGERWDGVPAAPAGAAPPRPARRTGWTLSPLAHGLLMLLGRCGQVFSVWIPLFTLAGITAAFVPDLDARVLAWLKQPTITWFGFGIVLTGVTVLLPASLCLQALALRALGRVRPGVVSQWSPEAIRVWIKTGLVEAANRWLSGTVFWPWWLRLAGMRIGRRCEISTIIDVVPETVVIGDESFFADGIYFCGPWRHRGTVTIAESILGSGTFLGNHAVVPAGHRWPAGFFVGVSTVADPRTARPGSAWFGQPAMELPRREVATADRRLTHEPGLLRCVTRMFWELLRFPLPVLPILVAFAWYACLAAAAVKTSLPVLLLVVAPLVTFAAQASLCLAVVALKWILLGRVRPGQHPLWSCWCSRWDFLYVAWGFWARRALAALEGTLLLNSFLRLIGVRIGRHVILGDGFSQVVDPDMLTFEDGATVVCHFQAHSFEDRILKIDRLRVGRGATVGSNAVVFYGADIGNRAWVGPHAVVMKRDVLEAEGHYIGCPTRRCFDGPNGSTSEPGVLSRSGLCSVIDWRWQ